VKRLLFVEDEDGHGEEEKENAEPTRPKRFCLKKFSSLANMDVSGEEEDDTGESEAEDEEETGESEGEEEESTGESEDEDEEEEEEDEDEEDEMETVVSKYFFTEAAGPK
jgi:hypothetical protein